MKPGFAAMRARCRSAGSAALRTAALIAATAGALIGNPAPADDSSFTSSAGTGSVDGAAIYARICQGCHMPQAQGAVGAGRYPKLAGDPALVSPEYVALTVLNGRHGMPPFGLPAAQAGETRTVHLSDSQVADVVNYVRSNFGNRYSGRLRAAQVAALPHPGSTSEEAQ